MEPGTIISIVIISLIAVAFIAVVTVGIINKKKGKHSCSCGGSCGACPAGCSCKSTQKPEHK